MPREDISISRERLATLRERAEQQFDFDYVENEGTDRIRFDRGATPPGQTLPVRIPSTTRAISASSPS